MDWKFFAPTRFKLIIIIPCFFSALALFLIASFGQPIFQDNFFIFLLLSAFLAYLLACLAETIKSNRVIFGILLALLSVLSMAGFIAYFTTSLCCGGQNTIGDLDAWNRGCNMIKVRGCDPNLNLGTLEISMYYPYDDNVAGTVADTCHLYLGYTDTEWPACIAACCNI
jgi:hypothetical protein